MLGDGAGPRRLLPTQSVSRDGVWDRLHLVRSEALELRRSEVRLEEFARFIRAERMTAERMVRESGLQPK